MLGDNDISPPLRARDSPLLCLVQNFGVVGIGCLIVLSVDVPSFSCRPRMPHSPYNGQRRLLLFPTRRCVVSRDSPSPVSGLDASGDSYYFDTFLDFRFQLPLHRPFSSDAPSDDQFLEVFSRL